VNPCLVAQALGCGAALWTWLCPAAPAATLLMLPGDGCCCCRSHDEFSRLLWHYRSQQAWQDKHMLI